MWWCHASSLALPLGFLGDVITAFRRISEAKPPNGISLVLAPFSFFLCLFSLCPRFPETFQLRGYSCSTQPELKQAGWALASAPPLTSHSTCPDLLRFFLGACFAMCGLMHPSEIKLGPLALFGLNTGFPTWPRFRFDLGICGLWVFWLNTYLVSLSAVPWSQVPWLFPEATGPRIALLMCPMEKGGY